MKLLYILSLIVLISSCLQDTNSNSFDNRFSLSNGVDTSTPAGQRLSDSYDIMNKNCMSCHTGYHNNWSGFNTDSKWIADGNVEAGDAYGSTLILRLKNISGNMPKDNPQVSEEEFDQLVNWINSI